MLIISRERRNEGKWLPDAQIDLDLSSMKFIKIQLETNSWKLPPTAWTCSQSSRCRAWWRRRPALSSLCSKVFRVWRSRPAHTVPQLWETQVGLAPLIWKKHVTPRLPFRQKARENGNVQRHRKYENRTRIDDRCRFSADPGAKIGSKGFRIIQAESESKSFIGSCESDLSVYLPPLAMAFSFPSSSIQLDSKRN